MKGILFKPAMIQAIIEGRKTQTRRVIKPQPYMGAWNATAEHPSTGWFWKGLYQTWEGEIDFFKKLAACARYQVGETVYAKEKALYWVSPVVEGIEYTKPSDLWSDCAYQDDPEIPALLADNGRLALERSINQVVEGNSIIGKWTWKSPLFMPEWAARYFITITDVRAERLQEITEEDVLAEGITVMRGTWQSKKWNEKTRRLELTGEEHPYTGRYHFKVIWNSLNAKRGYPWESNPWMWVIGFKKIADIPERINNAKGGFHNE